MAAARKDGLSPPLALGHVVWWGSNAAARKLLPAIEAAGLSARHWSRRASTLLEGAWAAVLFLHDYTGLEWEKIVLDVIRALDSGVNVVVVAPESPKAAFLIKGLKRRLLRNAILIAGETYDDVDNDQRLSDLPLAGGEVRTAPFDANGLLRKCYPPARRIPPLAPVDLRGVGVSTTSQRLLKHSFQDCNWVEVTPLHGGRAAVGVFRIIANIDGEKRLPFVAKVATRFDIVREARKFESRVRDFVPFASRPNWLTQRSFVLGSRGILVGQFAERTETLDVAVRRDGAVRAINDLFGSVFHRWWANSKDDRKVSATLAQLGLERWYNPAVRPDGERRRLTLSHRARAASQLGLPSLSEADLLVALCVPRFRRPGGIHGDLNCGNVLVRNDAAILIDYTHCDNGPLLADPAWLEVNLVFGVDWTAGSRSKRAASRRKSDWIGAIDRLYNHEALRHSPPLHVGEDLDDVLHRLCIAVRAIRRHAFEISASDGDYLDTVAAALVRFAQIDSTGTNRRDRQAGDERAARAYASASRLLSPSPTTISGSLP